MARAFTAVRAEWSTGEAATPEQHDGRRWTARVARADLAAIAPTIVSPTPTAASPVRHDNLGQGARAGRSP